VFNSTTRLLLHSPCKEVSQVYTECITTLLYWIISFLDNFGSEKTSYVLLTIRHRWVPDTDSAVCAHWGVHQHRRLLLVLPEVRQRHETVGSYPDLRRFNHLIFWQIMWNYFILWSLWPSLRTTLSFDLFLKFCELYINSHSLDACVFMETSVTIFRDSEYICFKLS